MDNIEVKLHKFMISAGFDDAEGSTFADLGFGPIKVQSEYLPEPFFFENDSASVFVLGTPVLKDSIAVKEVAEKLTTQWKNHDFLRSINSEFFFIVADKELKTLNIISSRYVSPPFFYYHKDGKLIGSFAFFDLWKRLHQEKLLQINQQSFYELMSYKRIFGNKTHDKNSKIIDPASVVTFDGKSVTSQKYWTPNFNNKLSISKDEAAENLGSLIQQSITRKTSDGVKPALFISGGMDTRSLLAAFVKLNKIPLCVTVNQFDNREVQVARKISEAVGAQHRFIPFHENHYSRFFEKALAVTGGLQLPFCMFLGYKELIDDASDTIFHGHGFDYMFQGMYLPRKHYYLFGRSLYYSRLKMPPSPLDEYFIKNVSYGIINHNNHCRPIIKNDHYDDLYGNLMEDIKKIHEFAKEISSNPCDMLEFFTFNNLARHYPFGDHWGMNTNLPQRTISFDNDLFDFYQKLPLKYRFDGRVFRKYLIKTNPELARMQSANTRYPVCFSNIQNTMYQLKDFALNRIKPSRKAEKESFERMGTPTNYLLVSELKNYTDEVLNSGRLETLDFIDMDGVTKYGEWFFENYQQENGQLMMALITMDQMLKQIQ